MTDLQSTITCPECCHQSTSTMPTDACVYIHECSGCGHVLKPKPGDCCVFCSYGNVPCPPVQAEVRDKSPENVSKAHSLRIEKGDEHQQAPLKEALATPESVFANRREFLASMGLGISGLAAAVVLLGQDEPSTIPAEIDPSADLYPVPCNAAFTLDRALTAESVNAKWNNFYEFGSHKEISGAAQALKVRPWMVTFDGLVEKPFEIGIDDLLAKMKLEERLYRHRCVEAWSMTIPWSGFPMKDLVALAKPLSSAKYVRMETFNNPAVAPGQKQTWNPWPYVEGLTIEEATNELAFIATGAYGKPMAKQHGAPLRLAVPWKYGFKHIKSITRFSFVADRPVSFWEKILPAEYGFWANINPEVPHPRWSQATERVLGTETRVATLPYNGYGELVAHLYQNIKGERLYT